MEMMFGPETGQLIVKTGVEGRAARMGHRLTIGMRTWSAQAVFDGDQPVAALLRVDLAGLEVLGGEGGVKPLSGPEKSVARRNALSCLDAERYPSIEFECRDVRDRPGGYDLVGRLRIHGQERPTRVAVSVTGSGDDRRVAVTARIRQTDFGIRPYALMMGSLRVADEVEVRFEAVAVRA